MGRAYLTLWKKWSSLIHFRESSLIHSRESSLPIPPIEAWLLRVECLKIYSFFGFSGTNVEPSIRGCFTYHVSGSGGGGDQPPSRSEPGSPTSGGHHALNGGGGGGLLVDCTDFVRWLKQEPQCLVWLPVLHRLASAETAKHSGVKCKVCKVSPIVGFR